MSNTKAVWLFVLALTAIRLTLLGTIDLEFDEAHYWMWSERLAPAYFSKGPGVAFVIRAGTAIFGNSEFGVRFWSPILGAGTSLLIYYFTRRLFNPAAGFWAIVALNAIPLFHIGNLLMTIDPLSIFFWTAAMFSFWLALERSPNFSWFWPLTGLLVGIGFLCKYTNALELVSVILVLALVPRLRREFKRPGLYLLLAVFAVCTLPPIIWNQQHTWATVTHLRSRGNLNHSFGLHLRELAGFLAMHFAVFSPVLFFGIAWGVIANRRRAYHQFKVLFLMWFGLPVFLFYCVVSINKQAAPNWDVLAFVSLGILAAAYWQERMKPDEVSGKKRSHPVFTAAVLIGLVLSLLTLNTDIWRTVGLPMFRRDPADRMRGWNSMSGAVEQVRNDLESRIGQPLFLIADERDRASEVAFYLRDKRPEGPWHPPVYIVESQDILNQFSFWPRYDEFVDAPAKPAPLGGDVFTEEGGVNPFEGRSALYLQSGKSDQLPHNITAAFQSTEKVAIIEVKRFDAHVRTLQVFLCRKYRTLSL